MAGNDPHRRSPLASGVVASPSRPANWREGEAGFTDQHTLPPPRLSPGQPMGRSTLESGSKPVLPKLSTLLADTEGPQENARSRKIPQPRPPSQQRPVETWKHTPTPAGPSSSPYNAASAGPSSSSLFDQPSSLTAGFFRPSTYLDTSAAGASSATGRAAGPSYPSEGRYSSSYDPARRSLAAPSQVLRPSASTSSGSGVDFARANRLRSHPYSTSTDPRESAGYAGDQCSLPRRLSPSPSPSQPSRQWAYVAPPAMTATPSSLPPRPVVWSGGGEARPHPGSAYRAPLLPDPVLHPPLAPTAPPPSLSPVLIPEEGEPRTFELIIRQQPMSGRMCGFGSKDFRPLDLLPIIELRIRDKDGKLDEDASSSPNLVVQASLLLGEEDTVAALTSNPYATNFPATRLLEGGVIASGHIAKDLDGSRACFFPFISLCVRLEGVFRLKFSLVKLGAPGWSPAAGPETISGTVLTSVVSQPFEVFSARKFPGMRESTALAKSLANQGIQVPIRNKRRAE